MSGFLKLMDEMWEEVEPIVRDILGPPSRHPAATPRIRLFKGIMYQLKTGCQWEMVPRTYAAKSTLHEHFQVWRDLGVMDAIFAHLVGRYDGLKGIKWQAQSQDGSLVQAPVRGEKKQQRLSRTDDGSKSYRPRAIWHQNPCSR